MSSLDLKPTLVMGASGSVGAHVLAKLLDHGRPVRASARRPEPGQSPAGLDVRAADLTDSRSLGAAFEGAGQVFLYANRDGVQGVIDSARNAGVDRIVLMSFGSVINPTSRGNAIAEEHRESRRPSRPPAPSSPSTTAGSCSSRSADNHTATASGSPQSAFSPAAGFAHVLRSDLKSTRGGRSH